MFKKIRSMLRADKSPFVPSQPVIAPDEPFFAIGDIHGCLPQMQTLLAQLDGPGPRIFLGDYVDRGPQSAQVLSELFTLQMENPDDVVCLKGNHEVMLLDFIDDPLGRGARWLKFGGLDTLASFGIAADAMADDGLDAALALERALPDGMLQWLRALPLRWSSGNMHCVHASMNPDKPPHKQSENALLWGHPDFFAKRRNDGQCVIHGHTIVPQGTVCDDRISVDTGAYQGGLLTAVAVRDGKASFISV